MRAALIIMAAALLPRPAMASTFTVPDMEAADAFAIKVIAEYSDSAEGHEWAVPSFDITVPIVPRLEAAVAFGRGHVHRSGTTAFNGWSDVEIAAKWELKPIAEEGGFGITVEPVLLIPLGEREVSEDDWRLELPVVFGWRTGPLTLHGMTGYSASFSDRGDAIPFGALATYDIGERLTVGVELVGSAPVSDLDGYEAEIGAGAAYAIADGWTVDGRVSRTVRIEGEAKSTNFLFGIEKEF